MAAKAASRRIGFRIAGETFEEGSERILGAHVLGPRADEVINVYAIAIRHGITAKVLRQTIFAYPTGASDIGYLV